MFTHLHVHSEFSLLDGLSSIDQIVQAALDNKMNSIALTDHGVMYGTHKFYTAVKRAGIKPIIGVEAYVAPRSRHKKIAKLDNKPYHLVLIAKNNTGYHNLIKLISLANIEGYYYKPRVDRELLKIYHEGLIASSACLAGEIPRHLYSKRYGDAKKTAQWYEKTFGKGNFYLELQANRLKEQKIVNKRMIDLSEVTGIPLIATTDAHYPTQADAFAQDVLLAVNTKTDMQNPDRLTMSKTPDFYIWSPKEMAKYFADTPSAIKNTEMISEMCNVDLDQKEWILPHADVPKDYKSDYNKYLWDLSHTKCKTRLGRKLTEDETKRLEYELKVIGEKGFSQYMLMTSEFTDWMREKGLPFTTRGSAAGSLVSFAIGIVNSNPLEFGLAFERFLNPLRPKAPDIDLDVASNVRDDLIKYTIKKHGKEKVAHIITFGRMQARGAIRDAGRVLGMSLDYVDKIAKLIPHSGQGLAKVNIKRALNEVAELRLLIDTDPDARKLIETAQKIEGRAKNYGLHACGILVTPNPITDYVPVILDKETGRMVTQYEMDSLEELKLIKVDFLGLKTLETIATASDLVQSYEDVQLDLDNLKFDDDKVYKTINDLDTLGIFQLESDVMKQTIKTIEPETIFDLSAVNALVRPGPNQYQKEYALRKAGKKKVEYIDPRMEKYLKNSFGVFVYQEDIIKTVIELGGMDWGEADRVRKATGKKKPDVLFAMKDEILERFVKNGISEANANKIFELFIPFTNYAFNQAHAVAYAIVVYITAWLKTYYPIEFMAALLKTEIQDKDKITKILEECYRKKISILPPSINLSDVKFKIEDKKNIRIGLEVIKGINKKSVYEIVKLRKERVKCYKCLDHMLSECDLTQISIKTFELLIMAGALDEFGDRNGLLEILPGLYKNFREQQRKKNVGHVGLFEDKKEKITEIISTPIPQSVNTTDSEKIGWEKELIGMFISEHPLKKASGIMKKYNITEICSIKNTKVGSEVLILGRINEVKKINTKKGDRMAFLKIEDLTEMIEVVVFPRVYDEHKDVFVVDKLVVIKGKVNDRNDKFTVIANKMKEITTKLISRYAIAGNENSIKKKHKTNNKSNIYYSLDDNKLKFCIPKNVEKDKLERLKKLIKDNPGDTKVLLECDCGDVQKCIEVSQGVSIGNWMEIFN